MAKNGEKYKIWKNKLNFQQISKSLLGTYCYTHEVVKPSAIDTYFITIHIAFYTAFPIQYICFTAIIFLGYETSWKGRDNNNVKLYTRNKNNSDISMISEMSRRVHKLEVPSLHCSKSYFIHKTVQQWSISKLKYIHTYKLQYLYTVKIETFSPVGQDLWPAVSGEGPGFAGFQTRSDHIQVYQKLEC